MKTIPSNLIESINLLISDNNEYISNISNIIDMDEDEFICEFHHSVGRKIRNLWGLWENKTEISQWFESLGIIHADDKSSIILKSFHRTINKKDIKLDEQVLFYKNYWEKNNE